MSRRKTKNWYIVKIDDNERRGSFVPGEYGFDANQLKKLDSELKNEAISEMKKLLVANGVRKFPSGMRFLDDRADWEKCKGYAGKKTISNMMQQLEEAGWTEGEGSSGISPDGSSAGNGDKYTSPDGRIVASMYSYYGGTSYDNSFSITFKLIG